MASDDLRRQCDTFVDLADLAAIIGRPRQERNNLPRFIHKESADLDVDEDA
jgi:uncharacterized LabA/DUF88 family protein